MWRRPDASARHRLQVKKVQNLFQRCFDVSCFVQPPIVALLEARTQLMLEVVPRRHPVPAAAVYCMLQCVSVFRSTGLN